MTAARDRGGPGDQRGGGAGGGFVAAVKRTQIAYHDWEADRHERKFAIDFDERCRDYVRGRFRKVARSPHRCDRVLEVGTGTGFFLLNLALAGCLDGDGDAPELHASDISTGMLDVCRANAERTGVAVTLTAADLEALPYGDATFDLVVGHAVLHHVPRPDVALRELRRVLAPGGTVVLAGEPTVWGDRIAAPFKRATYALVRAVTAPPGLRGLRAPTLEELPEAEAALAGLEHEVDLHTFRPGRLRAQARAAGLRGVTVVTEELTANWFGWVVRTAEGALRDGVLGDRWAAAVGRIYRVLARLDDRVLAGRVPAPLFYNVVLSAHAPHA